MSDAPPYLPGQFVWCMFPFSEAPDRPGPERHIGYIQDVLQRGDRTVLAMALFTTTRPWPSNVALPIGIIPVPVEEARRSNQRAFVVDARRIAFMPVDRAFFPDLDDASKGIQGTAPPALQRRIERTLAELAKRPELIELLGPQRPTRPRSRK